MATLSEDDYNELKPFIPMLDMYREHGIYVGCDMHAFKKIYDKIAHENMNVSCGGCISNALSRTNDLIKEYNGSTKK